MSFFKKVFRSVSSESATKNLIQDDAADEDVVEEQSPTTITTTSNTNNTKKTSITSPTSSSSPTTTSSSNNNKSNNTNNDDSVDHYTRLTFVDEALKNDLIEGVGYDMDQSFQQSQIQKGTAIPRFKDEKLTEDEKSKIQFCIEKLKNIEGVDPKKIQTVAQNCVLPERFKYKFFNPSNDNTNNEGIGSNKKNKVATLRIKFVITELDQSAHMRIVRRIGHTLNFTKDTIFGMFHTAIIIGNWYLEFNDNGLAIVRKNSSSKAVFAFDLCKIVGEREISICLDKISKECCKWNGTITYDNKKCNCQHFTQAILDSINFKFESKLQGSTLKYIERLKSLGVCDMTIDLSSPIKELFNNSNTITFKSHLELDLFYKTIKDKYSNYFDTENGRQDEILLKSFDRAFWLRRESSKASARDEPLRDQESNCCLCPFNQYEANYQAYMEQNSITGANTNYLGNYYPEIPKR
ncbi:hypothetical protein ABK040_008669 [Willaertia magna]